MIKSSVAAILFRSIVSAVFLFPVLSGIGVAEDTTSPDISYRALCGDRLVEVHVADSGTSDLGLASVRLDRAGSFNVEIEGEGESLGGLPGCLLRLRLTEGAVSGKGIVIAEDLAGNRNSIEIDLSFTSPEFSTLSINMSEVKRNEERVGRITLRNPSASASMQVGDFSFADGRRFGIAGRGSEGRMDTLIPPGGSYEIDVLFRSGIRTRADDTLFLDVDCSPHAFPLAAEMAAPLISLENLDFFQVLIGNSVCGTLRLSNPGTDTLEISAIEIGGEYRFDTAAIPDLPRKVSPGEEFALPICFLPRRLGLQLGSVRVLSSASNSDGGVAQLLGIGVSSFSAVGFDGEENAVQLSIVPHGDYLTVVAIDRGRSLGEPFLYSIKGENIPITEVRKIGEGWWQLKLEGRLTGGIYFFHAKAPTEAPFDVKFVVVR